MADHFPKTFKNLYRPYEPCHAHTHKQKNKLATATYTTNSNKLLMEEENFLSGRLQLTGYARTERCMGHGYTVYTENTEMAAVSHGTSHVTAKQHCKYTTSVDIQKATVTHFQSHATRVQ